ncbi:hypothetical protein LA20533_08315 [Amylolactobacillus amylophilus DSM 20533 = JCM 1125]|uniref:YitT family protein n=1 Tax=Amylolactobacillus amylophilus DSM 20533 = JCM 1125 TaxID=1423721 RepID=A0A1L6XE52_9LACO|nr:hypothetical protein LA20533_08315 [Amylolactobacillus amylophilus DSM 20533 = JCM 1125]
MDHLTQMSRQHNLISKVTAAFFYSIAVAIALNFFWHPGGIYASGVTGFAQVVQTLTERYFPFVLSTSIMYFVLNIPLFFALSSNAIEHCWIVSQANDLSRINLKNFIGYMGLRYKW